MKSLLILIPLAIVFVIIAVGIFFWAVRSGQYEDLETEGRRILFDDEQAKKSSPSVKSQSDKVENKKP